MVNCSISESEDASDRGFPTWQVNRVTLQVVAALFGQGAGVMFGHDWREDGVMEAVYGFALQVQPPVPLFADDPDASSQPLLFNMLPWPDSPFLPNRDLERLASTLRVESAGLPYELEQYRDDARREAEGSALYRYLRARGLTHLRHRLTSGSHARVCLGGKSSGSDGRYPGIIEEAFLAMQKQLPLYIVGFLGGAALQIIEAIKAQDMPSTFCAASNVSAVYSQPPVPERDPATLGDRRVDRYEVWKQFHETGAAGLAERNGLSVEENEELFSTSVLDSVVQLVLTGLSRLRAGGRI
jgi:hypothetical protein